MDPVDIEEERGFTGDVDQCIRLAQKKIAAREMVEGYKAYIQELQKKNLTTDEWTSNYEEGEPPGLPRKVYERIYHLKWQIAAPAAPAPESCKINMKAVLEAYRAGNLEIKSGLVSYWVDGVQISDLVPHDVNEIIQLAGEYIDQGKAFSVERPQVQTCLAAATVPAPLGNACS